MQSLLLPRACIWLAGLWSLANFATSTTLAQSAGSLDAGFTLTQVLGDRVNAVSVQTDGNIVIGGTISQVDGRPTSEVARVHADGTLDTGFAPPELQSYNTLTDSIVTQLNPDFVPVVFTTALQGDGKILVGGSFYFIDGEPGYGGLTRLNPDGSLDRTFKAPRFSGTVFSIVPLSNGKILVGGDFNYVDNAHINCLVQLDPNGRLATAFTPGIFEGTLSASDAVSAFPTVHTIAVQPNGKIVIGGIFTKIAGIPRRAVARLGVGGMVDTSFVPDPSFDPASSSLGNITSIDQVLSLAVQSDGKVVIGGDFRDPGTGNPINSVYRLDSAGSLDGSFNPGGAGTYYSVPNSPGYNGVVYAVALQPDGKILLGGDFVAYNGVVVFLLARLNTDGTLDTSFNDGSGPDNDVYSLALQPNGQLVVGGAFQTVDDVARPRVARFNTVVGVPPAVVVNIVASKPRAKEEGKIPGTFTVTRTGSNQTADLLVNYAVTGTAQPKVNYKPLSGQVIIPGGSSSAVIDVVPRGSIRANKKVTVTLNPSAAYGVTAHPSASVIIVAGPPAAGG